MRAVLLGVAIAAATSLASGQAGTACVDDGFEDNDSCQTATVLADGTYPGLVAAKRADDPDWFNFLVPPGNTIALDVLFAHADGDVDVVLYGDCAGTQLDVGDSASDDERVQFTNNLSITLSVFLEVALDEADAADCNDYTLVATTRGNCTFDDEFQGNSTCASAELLAAGSYSHLVAFKRGSAPDWYNFLVPPGHTIALDVLFGHAYGDVDAVLYGDCAGTQVDVGDSVDDDEHVRFTNNLSVTLSVFLEVYLDDADAADCSTPYGLVATLVDGPGLSFCPTVANSTGGPALISGEGSTSLAADDFTLTVAPVPNDFVFFIYGTQTTQRTLFNDGFICVGPGFQRILPPGRASNNAFTKAILPGSHAFPVGQTANFQCFYRDPAVLPDRSNTSDAYSVLFVN